MNNRNLIKAAGAALFLLGLAHLAAAAQGAPGSAELSRVLAAMGDYKIQLLGEHSLLQFHHGFSSMMGLLLTALGAQSYLLAEPLSARPAALGVSALASAIGLWISILCFHLLATAFLLFSFGCFALALARRRATLVPAGSRT